MFFSHVCHICNKTFRRLQQLSNHRRTTHDKHYYLKFFCEICKKSFENQSFLHDHIIKEHEENLNYKLFKSAFNRKFSLYRKYFYKEEASSPNILLEKKQISDIAKTIYVFMQSYPWIKYNICLAFSFGQFDSNGVMVGNDEFF